MTLHPIRASLIVILCTVFLPFNTLADDFTKQMEALEQKEGGRIGMAALDTTNGKHLEYRADDRFAMCSTFKLLLVATVLSRVDAGTENVNRLITYGEANMQDYAPITKQHLDEKHMSVAGLSAAAIDYSDNTAANLLLQSVGGPEKLTEYARSLGDTTTRLDRNEPTLNTNIQGDVRDTTTPSAFLQTMQKLLIGDALSPQSKQYLISLLIGNTTGDKKLRAGMNAAWKVGDKTGSGQNGASNDVAIVWPTDKKPFLITVYYSGADSSPEKQSAVIANIGRMVSVAFYAH